MKTSEVILVFVNTTFGYDSELTKTFLSSEKADAYAAEMIKKLSMEVDDEEVSDDDIEDYLDCGYWESSSDDTVNVTVSEITHHAE